MKKITRAIIAASAAAALLTGCSNEADTASENISTAADNFKVLRRIVFVNGITDTYLLTIEGFCNIVDEGNQLEVTCKIADGDSANSYKKHFLSLSDNTFYFAEQLEASSVDPYHLEVMFRPEAIVPDVNLETSGN